MQTKVLIIGAGPTGLMMASQLARFGVDAIIIDQKSDVTTKSKALAVQARVMEAYQQMGIAAEAVEQGMMGKGVNFIIKGEKVRRIDLENMGKGLSPFPYIHMLEQSKNEALLNNFLEAKGSGVLWNTSLDTFTEDKHGVTATLNHKDGEVLTIKADWLIGADGASSPVRKQIGMTFKGGTYEQTFFVADVQIDWSFEAHELFICLSENDFMAFFPMKGDRHFRLVGAVPKEMIGQSDLSFQDILDNLIPKMDFELTLQHLTWFATYKIHHRVVNNFQRGRCFLAGDAAHIHSPAGGQGMNTGLMDAYNLAWKLALVVQEKASPKLLKTYNEERLPFAKQLVKTTDTAFETIASPNPLIRFFRLNFFPHALKFATSFAATRKFAFKTVSQIAVNYRAGSLSRNNEHQSFSAKTPKAGDRFPYYQVNGKSVFEWFQDTSFHALYFYTAENPTTIQKLVNYFNFAKIHIVLHPLPKTTYATLFEDLGINEKALFIIRPDMYIGYRSNVVDLADLEIYFEQHLALL